MHSQSISKSLICSALGGLMLCLVSCSGGSSNSASKNTSKVIAGAQIQGCMSCHNGSQHDDYNGPGLENPHPFPGAATLLCTECHGGNGLTTNKKKAHVPSPPEIGEKKDWEQNRHAYFNRLTLTGIDKFADYDVDGVTYSAIDYLQFIAPGDLRVVTLGRSCGACHDSHAECVARSLLATEAGILSGAKYAVGVDNIDANTNYFDTASDMSFRSVSDPAYAFDSNNVGAVSQLTEFPVYSVRNDTGPLAIHNNNAYAIANLPNSIDPTTGRLINDSPLANLFHEQIAFTCGDCHLGSAGANNRYGDFRSSGCTSCHMRYSLSGRSTLSDKNIKRKEPRDPDDLDPPELPHIDRHLIRGVAKTLTTGEFVTGMDDYTCAGCHQGSNRTVMQYWGIRLDQNADVARRVQYPDDPVTFRTTRDDPRLFDRKIDNRTFNGRNANQYLLFEDYDGDGRDDTPPDVHYEAGLGCIDCHGSHDLHGGNVGDPTDASIYSRQEQAVAIRCESCHGGISAYADYTSALTYDGVTANVAMDAEGHPLRHVVRESDGTFWLTSRLTGERHYVPQTMDTVVDSGKTHPDTGNSIYNVKASYAMGRADGSTSTGLGPQQEGAGIVSNGFSHTDEMSCVACHASWTNNCVGCHLGGEYDTGNNFSNITGDRIVFEQEDADFIYQNPVLFHLGVDAHNKVAPISPNTETFFQYRDLNGEFSEIFAFSDRNDNGNNTNQAPHPSLSHNVMMPHSIRGRVSTTNEGPRYCVACHLTTQALTDYGTEYDTFRAAIAADDFTLIDFDLLQQHIGKNPGNQMNSPFWVHSVTGLGTGLFLLDENGCPINPLDTDDRRWRCFDSEDPDNTREAPATTFDPATFMARVRYNLDRLVTESGATTGSNNHTFLAPLAIGESKRDGAANEDITGPLGGALIQALSDPVNGVILDSWIDANGDSHGNSSP